MAEEGSLLLELKKVFLSSIDRLDQFFGSLTSQICASSASEMVQKVLAGSIFQSPSRGPDTDVPAVLVPAPPAALDRALSLHLRDPQPHVCPSPIPQSLLVCLPLTYSMRHRIPLLGLFGAVNSTPDLQEVGVSAPLGQSHRARDSAQDVREKTITN